MANSNSNVSSSSKNKTVRGSLPCGNPKRYTSADVVQMRADERKQTSSSSTSENLGDQQTESDQYLQTVLQRQIDTDITIKQQFSQHRSFTESSSHAPSVDILDGLHSLEEHVKLDEYDSTVEYLKSCELTREEIAFKLKHELSRKNGAIASHGFGADPAMEKAILQEIERKLAKKEEALSKPDKFNGGLELSRQALVLEKAVLEKQNKEAILPEFLFRQKKVHDVDPDDPINHIPEILSDIEPKPSREPRRDRRRKRKLNQKFLRQQQYLGANSDPSIRQQFMESVGLATESHTDISEDENDSCAIRERIHVDEELSKNEDIALTSDSIQNDGKDIKSSDDDCESKEDVPITKIKKKKKSFPKITETFTMSDVAGDVCFITDGEIEGNKLSLQEILSIDRFQNYDEGHPNRTVFVKNLPNNVAEIDLVSLFGRYQRCDAPAVLFRLLNGRMKGQAFVTFPDEDTAQEAISKLNGYKLRGKPVIVSFSKNQDDSNRNK